MNNNTTFLKVFFFISSTRLLEHYVLPVCIIKDSFKQVIRNKLILINSGKVIQKYFFFLINSKLYTIFVIF